MNSRFKETIFVAGVFIATLIAVCTWPFVREAAAQAPSIKRNYFTTNQDPTITNISTNTFTFAVTNLIITNTDGSYFFFELGADSCLTWVATNGVAFRICLLGGGTEFIIGQIGPVLQHANRLRFLSNGVTEIESVRTTGNSSNVAFQVVGPANEGNPVWDLTVTNSGWGGLGNKFKADDGTFKLISTTITNLLNVYITNLTVVSNFFSILNSHLNSTFITNLTIVSNAFTFNNTTITNINQEPAYNTNVDGAVNNFISMHLSSRVQATMTNNLATGSNVTNTHTLTNLSKNASLSMSFYGSTDPSTNYVKFQVPSGSFIRWLSTTNGSSDFGVTSNTFGVVSFWLDRETNVFACFRGQ